MDGDIVPAAHIRNADFAEPVSVLIENFDNAAGGIDMLTRLINVNFDSLPQDKRAGIGIVMRHFGLFIWHVFKRGLDCLFVCLADEVVRNSGGSFVYPAAISMLVGVRFTGRVGVAI